MNWQPKASSWRKWLRGRPIGHAVRSSALLDHSKETARRPVCSHGSGMALGRCSGVSKRMSSGWRVHRRLPQDGDSARQNSLLDGVDSEHSGFVRRSNSLRGSGLRRPGHRSDCRLYDSPMFDSIASPDLVQHQEPLSISARPSQSGSLHILGERIETGGAIPLFSPVELPKRFIDLYKYRRDLVLDPFAGACTVAAEFCSDPDDLAPSRRPLNSRCRPR